MLKKKKKEAPVIMDYKDWANDFGFLNLILSRKKNITREFVINITNKQRSDKDYLTDEDIEPIIVNCINETIAAIGENYRNFLINKYFGSFEQLVSFISEDCYTELLAETIKMNTTKISSNFRKKNIQQVLELNNQQNKE